MGEHFWGAHGRSVIVGEANRWPGCFGHHEVIGSTMGTFAEFEGLTALVAAGLPVVVDSVYPLADYPAALERLAAGEQFGKIVLAHR